MISSLVIYLLFIVTEPEEEQIVEWLTQNDDPYPITIVFWTGSYEGDTSDINTLFAAYPAQDVMIVLDRKGWSSGNFIVANGKAATSPAFMRKTLQHYGYTYNKKWYQDTALVNLVSRAGVPMGRVAATQGVLTVYESIVTGSIDWETVIDEVEISVDGDFDTSALEAQVGQAREQYGDEEDDDDEETDEEVEETQHKDEGEGTKQEGDDANDTDDGDDAGDGEGDDGEGDDGEGDDGEGDDGEGDDGEGDDGEGDDGDDGDDGDANTSDGNENAGETSEGEEADSGEEQEPIEDSVTSQQGEDDGEEDE